MGVPQYNTSIYESIDEQIKSAVINYLQIKSAVINYLQIKSAVINYLQIKSAVINYLQIKSAVINYLQIKSAVINYLQIKSAVINASLLNNKETDNLLSHQSNNNNKNDDVHMWPKDTVITGDSILNGLEENCMRNIGNHSVKVRAFPGAVVLDMYSYITPLLMYWICIPTSLHC